VVTCPMPSGCICLAVLVLWPRPGVPSGAVQG
jgi:hypothetical protein